jgi:AraC-like DNA-binding protein/mannose-6-phosphate isomerase-like protein (cupin superfamily)
LLYFECVVLFLYTKGTEMGESKTVFEEDRITDGFDIFFWVFNDASSYVSTHWHTAIEIMYIMQGEVTITYKNRNIMLVPGDVFLTDSRVPHSTKSLNGNRAILLQLPYEWLKRYIRDIDAYTFSFDCHSGNPEQQVHMESLIEKILKMKACFESSERGTNLRFNSIVFEMLDVLYTRFAVPIDAELIKNNIKKFHRLEPVLQYSNDHYNEQITLPQIAEISCLQPEYFCHFFKKNIGVTYVRYLNEIRLAHIYHDLSETDYTLQQLLEMHGFTNYKLFRAMFYEKFNTTPGKYRQQHKK